jgi:hypothetical protein
MKKLNNLVGDQLFLQMSRQMIDGIEYVMCYDFILRLRGRIVGYFEDGVAHLCSQAEAFAAQDRKIHRDAVEKNARDTKFWAEVAASERENNRILLLCQYQVYGRPRDRVRIEELTQKEGRELYPDEDTAFMIYETPIQTEARWRAAAVRRRRIALLAYIRARI